MQSRFLVHTVYCIRYSSQFNQKGNRKITTLFVPCKRFVQSPPVPTIKCWLLSLQASKMKLESGASSILKPGANSVQGQTQPIEESQHGRQSFDSVLREYSRKGEQVAMGPEKVPGHGKASEDSSLLGASWGGKRRRGWMGVQGRAFPVMCDKCTRKTYCHQVTLYLSLSARVALGLANGEGGRLGCRGLLLERGVALCRGMSVWTVIQDLSPVLSPSAFRLCDLG